MKQGNYIDLIIVTSIVIIIAWYLIQSIIRMLCNSGNNICNSQNYKGKVIPVIGGIVFIPVQLAAVLQLTMQRPEHAYGYLSYMFLLLSMGFVGVIDDLAGDRRIKGLINHVRSTLNNNMTTGFLKALIGFMAASIISLRITASFAELIVNVLIITLYANTINLFDMRPGRAVKVFLTMGIILLFSAEGKVAEALPLIVLILTALIYISYDLREICMLGDTGANILGITLGYYSSIFLNNNSKLFLLAILILLNILSEKKSITAYINKSKILTFIDSLGREQADN